MGKGEGGLPSRNGMPQMGHSSLGLRDFLGTRSSSEIKGVSVGGWEGEGGRGFSLGLAIELGLLFPTHTSPSRFFPLLPVMISPPPQQKTHRPKTER